MKLGKFALITFYICLTLVVASMSFAIISLTLTGIGQFHAGFFSWFLFGFFIGFMLLIGIVQTFRMWAMENKPIPIDKSFARYTYFGYSLYELVLSLFFIFVTIIAISTLLRFALTNLSSVPHLIFMPQFFAFIFGFIVIIPLGYPALGIFKKLVLKISNTAAYTLSANGLYIDLKIYTIGKAQKPPAVFIGFDELNQIEIMNYRQAALFKQYRLNTDLQLSVQAPKEQYSYLKGNIARPKVYITDPSIYAQTVYMRGPELCYFITFQVEDASDILKAFQAYKSDSSVLRH